MEGRDVWNRWERKINKKKNVERKCSTSWLLMCEMSIIARRTRDRVDDDGTIKGLLCSIHPSSERGKNSRGRQNKKKKKRKKWKKNRIRRVISPVKLSTKYERWVDICFSILFTIMSHRRRYGGYGVLYLEMMKRTRSNQWSPNDSLSLSLSLSLDWFDFVIGRDCGAEFVHPTPRNGGGGVRNWDELSFPRSGRIYFSVFITVCDSSSNTSSISPADGRVMSE